MIDTPQTKPDIIVAVGSVDGVLTAAAARRHFNPDAEIYTAQAQWINDLNPEEWGKDKNILFVDLGVADRDNGKATKEFVNRLHTQGHKIVGICDEHNAEQWQEVADETALDIESLAIKPVTAKNHDTIKSSGALLLSHIGTTADQHTKDLCTDADRADGGLNAAVPGEPDFTGKYASWANKAIKSNQKDDAIKRHVAEHFSAQTEPSEKIKGWAAEYDLVQKNNADVVAERVNLKNGLVQVNAVGKKVDNTVICETLCKEHGATVAEIIFTDSFKGQEKTEHQFATFGRRDIDLEKIMEDAGIKSARGRSFRINVSPDEAEQARLAVQEALKEIEAPKKINPKASNVAEHSNGEDLAADKGHSVA